MQKDLLSVILFISWFLNYVLFNRLVDVSPHSSVYLYRQKSTEAQSLGEPRVSKVRVQAQGPSKVCITMIISAIISQNLKICVTG